MSSKIGFEKLLLLATKESPFIFNRKPCREVDEFPMDAPLGLTLAYIFLVWFQSNWRQNCLSDFMNYFLVTQKWWCISFMNLIRIFRSLPKFWKLFPCCHIIYNWQSKAKWNSYSWCWICPQIYQICQH